MRTAVGSIVMLRSSVCFAIAMATGSFANIFAGFPSLEKWDTGSLCAGASPPCITTVAYLPGPPPNCTDADFCVGSVGDYCRTCKHRDNWTRCGSSNTEGLTCTETWNNTRYCSLIWRSYVHLGAGGFGYCGIALYACAVPTTEQCGSEIPVVSGQPCP